MQKQIIKVEKEQIFSGSESYFRKICGGPKRDMGDLWEEAWNIREQYKERLIPHICVSLYRKEELGVSIGEKEDWKITLCKEGDSEDFFAVYAMGIPEISSPELDLLEQFYLDSWMTAMLDSAREWLRDYLEKYVEQKWGEKRYVSEAFGPGFFDIDLEEIPKILEMAGGEEIGVSWTGKTLLPPKSNVGYFYISKEEKGWKGRDCRHCLSNHKNCVFCKNA